MPTITLRPALPHEAGALTALCIRSKAHWGYDAAFMQASAKSLAISGAMIASGRVLVAQDGQGVPLGVATLEPIDRETFDLAHFFVEPRALRLGIGRALFAAIVEKAKKSGTSKLVILADPNATDFYIRMGARLVGDAPSDSIPGRRLPLLSYSL